VTALRVTGARALRGSIQAAGNKNAALPLVAAALLTDEPVRLDNVPDIGDIRVMLELVAAAGAQVDWERASGTLRLRARDLTSHELPDALYASLRAGILLAAPLLARRGAATMVPPGGDVIGRRRLDAHVEGLAALGVRVETDAKLRFSAPQGLHGADIFLPEASVTATEQVLMAAAVAKGTTVIRNAACEPHVQDLANLLTAMGARVDGIGSNTLTVTGTERLHGASFRIGSDVAEAASFLALAAASHGDVTVTGVNAAEYRMIARTFRRLGVGLEIGPDRIRVGPDQALQVVPELAGGIPVIDDGVWPQFPSDLMSVTIVLATQVQGTVLFFEKLYESRMYFVDRLVAMGANAVICDPHRAVISGPSRLHGIVLQSPDIRAGIALLGAALCARGESLVRNAESIDRGYEKIEDKLRCLGAEVERVQG
jgi:UDP-N-acetylglucosamine 1-carboxyvinyltransferase